LLLELATGFVATLVIQEIRTSGDKNLVFLLIS